jgi:hypothetical protein
MRPVTNNMRNIKNEKSNKTTDIVKPTIVCYDFIERIKIQATIGLICIVESFSKHTMPWDDLMCHHSYTTHLRSKRDCKMIHFMQQSIHMPQCKKHKKHSGREVFPFLRVFFLKFPLYRFGKNKKSSPILLNHDILPANIVSSDEVAKINVLSLHTISSLKKSQQKSIISNVSWKGRDIQLLSHAKIFAIILVLLVSWFIHETKGTKRFGEKK